MATPTTRRNKDGSESHTFQIRLKRDDGSRYTESQTFKDYKKGERWAASREQAVIESGVLKRSGDSATIADLIGWYVEKYKPLLKWGKNKSSILSRMKESTLGACVAGEADVRAIKNHIEERRLTVAAHTAMQDLTFLRQVFLAARADDRTVNPYVIDEAKQSCKQMKLVQGGWNRRMRRPKPAELETLDAHFAASERKRKGPRRMPMRALMWFAVWSVRRQEEITKLRWPDLDAAKGTIIVRNLKHPTKKGWTKTARLTAEALKIIAQQPRREGEDRIFPYNNRSICGAWIAACKKLGIEDLHFHDLRHQGISSLFERGYDIVRVAGFSLHEKWADLQIYTQLDPADIDLLPVRRVKKPQLKLVKAA